MNGKVQFHHHFIIDSSIGVGIVFDISSFWFDYSKHYDCLISLGVTDGESYNYWCCFFFSFTIRSRTRLELLLNANAGRKSQNI